MSITCINDGLKQLLIREARNLEDPTARRSLREALDELPSCSDGSLIGVTSSRGGKRGGPKREPSEWNLFVKDCMQRRPQARPVQEHMKQCAVEWKQRGKSRR